MSIRTSEVPPSAAIELDGQQHPVVTRDDLVAALVDAAIVLHHAGGCLGVILQRVPTGTPNEFVTTRALVTWQDRTNAKPQSEPDARQPVGIPVDGIASAVENGNGAELSTDPPQGAVDEVGDGLFVDPLAEDDSEIPASMRA